MADRILINDLRCDAVIGVSGKERADTQELEIDLELAFAPERRTQIRETADYRKVVSLTREVAIGEERKLLEHLADDIARALVDRFEVEAVTVRVRKPRIAEKYGLGSIGVEVTR